MIRRRRAYGVQAHRGGLCRGGRSGLRREARPPGLGSAGRVRGAGPGHAAAGRESVWNAGTRFPPGLRNRWGRGIWVSLGLRKPCGGTACLPQPFRRVARSGLARVPTGLPCTRTGLWRRGQAGLLTRTQGNGDKRCLVGGKSRSGSRLSGPADVRESGLFLGSGVICPVSRQRWLLIVFRKRVWP